MNEATSELLADANNTVREQLAIAWHEHIERVSNVLVAQWPERMERLLEETIAALAARLEAGYQDDSEARLQQAAQSGLKERRELIRQLNQVARRLLSCENERQWSNTLVDATRGFCGRAAVFLIQDRKLHLETTRNFDDVDLPGAISLVAAPAFATAVDTRDMLIAIRSRGELSQEIAAYVDVEMEAPDQEDAKCYLFPVVTRQAIPAILYADSAEVDINALELLAAMAGAVYESRPDADAPVSPVAFTPGLVSISIPIKTPGDKGLHLRAQRSARVEVAKIRLYQSERVKNGRTAHDLYTSLKPEIDSAREAFRREFMKAPDSTVDYFHVELVKTLANDDAELLGHHYPGPMV